METPLVTPRHRNAWGMLNLGAAATVWGSTFVVSRYALASVPSLHLVILRFACSTALFMVLFLVRRPRMPHGREWWLYLGSAASGYVLSIPLQFLGTSLTSAHIGSIVTCATPLAMVVLAGLVVSMNTGESPSRGDPPNRTASRRGWYWHSVASGAEDSHDDAAVQRAGRFHANPVFPLVASRS